MEKNEIDILIIGAGVSGLLLAQSLKKQGIECTVFEQETSAQHARPREWGMSVQWSLPLLHKLLPPEMSARIPSVAVDPFYDPPDPGEIPIINAESGELLKALPLTKVYRVSRRKFRALLAEGIDIQYGKEFGDYELADDGVHVTGRFQDGTSAVGTALIATDGSRSTVRTKLFDASEAKVEITPYTVISLDAKFDDAELAKSLRKWNPIYTIGVHPAGFWTWLSIQDVPDPEDPTTWTFQLMCTWKTHEGEEATTLASLKDRASSFAHPFGTAFRTLPEGTRISANQMGTWVPKPWNSSGGRIAILGDAAHPMTFQRGQGLNHCVADVSQLVKSIEPWKEGSLSREQAIQQYQEEMIARAGQEVKLSVQNTEMLHDWDKLLQSPLLQRAGTAVHQSLKN